MSNLTGQAIEQINNLINASRQQQQSQIDGELMQALLGASAEERPGIIQNQLKIDNKPSIFNRLLSMPTRSQYVANSPISQLETQQQLYGAENTSSLTPEETQKADRIKAGLLPRATAASMKPPAPITSTALKNYGATMDSVIDNNERVGAAGGLGNFGKANWPKENLLKAWGQFQELTGYDSLPETQKRQLKIQWDAKILNRDIKAAKGPLDRRGEYEWDPAAEAAPAAETGTQQVQTEKPAGYPDAVWNEEFKMWTVVRGGRLKGIE
jgi:hypothetical protein